MPLNPNISLAYKGIELQDPLAQYGKVMALQSAQQQNALAQRQMQQEEELTNYLRSNDLSTPEKRAGLRQFGKPGLAYENALTDQETNALRRDELAMKVQNERLSALGTGLTSVLQDPSDANLEAAFRQLESVKIDTTPFRQQFAQITDPAQRKAVITQYALTNEVGRKALEFVQPKPVRADIGGKTIWVDENPNSPTYLQEVKSVEQAPKPEGVYAQDVGRAAAGAPRTLVQSFQEREEAKEYGKRLVKDYDAVAEAAKLAHKTLPSIDTNLRILDKGFKTGFGTETVAAAASVLGALGVENASQYATNAQLFNAKAKESVLQKQLEQRGPATEQDAQRIDQTGSRLGNTPEANKFLLAVAKEQLRRDIEKRDFYNKWRSSKGTYDGAEAAWDASDGSRSLFDRPALKQYMTGSSETVSRIPGTTSKSSSIRSQADAILGR